MSEPIDQEARDRAVRELWTSFAVAAGAGSGKTRLLSDRVIEALAAGTPARAIAAVTFTEKATTELRMRIRDGLEARHEAARGPERERLTRALGELSELTISTLHGFCLELLTLEALEADWPPGARVGGGGGAATERAIAAWRRELARETPQVALHASGRALGEAARALLGLRDLAPVVGSAEVPWADARAELLEIEATLTRAASGCRAPGTCVLLEKNRSLREHLRVALADPDPGRGVRDLLGRGDRGDLRGGRAADWPDRADREAFHAAIKEVRAFVERWKERALGPLHRRVVESLRDQLLPAVREARLDAGEVEYDDLLFAAAELLERRGEARRRLAERFRHLLVDEVQDTDPVQSRVVLLLARAPDAEGPWDAHPARPGGLFAVGDPKQSIYRFRRADLGAWRALHERVAAGGGAIELVQNFRSVPGIVGFVNEVFASLEGHVELATSVAPTALEPVVVLPAAREDETEAVVRHLRALVDGGAEVRDPVSGRRRPMGYRDVMILLPSWTRAEEVQDALVAAGIPSRVEGGTSFFRRDEVRFTLAAMTAIEEPSDAEAVVASLRGLFGFSHPELAQHVAKGGGFHPFRPKNPPGPVTEALRRLGQLHRRRGRRSWAAIVDELLAETRASAVWALGPRGRFALANLDKLRALILDLELAEPSPGLVVERLRALARTDGEQDLPAGDPDLDAATITTVFRAKGLEAPVVVVLHAHRQLRAGDAVVDRTAGAVALKVRDLAPPDWPERKAREEAELALERRRWMYVACTRARDQLVLVGGVESNLFAETDLAEVLRQAVAVAGRDAAIELGRARARVVAWRSLPEVARRAETFPGWDAAVDAWLAEPPPAGDPAGEAWLAARRAAVRAAAKPVSSWRSVTELTRRARGGRGAGIGVEVGRAVHRALEGLDLTRSPEALLAAGAELAEAEARVAGLGEERAARAGELARRLLAHPVIAEARAAPERWREVPFALRERGRVVTGVIDLCFPIDASRREWVVVDWKTDLPAEGTPARAAYERQIAAYARGLLAGLGAGGEVDVRTVLVGPHPELAPAEADSALDEVHPALAEGLAALLRGGAPVPAVGVDVGDPVVGTLELAFEERRVGLVLDRSAAEAVALADLGYRLVFADSGTSGWAARALAELAAHLGLPPPTPAPDEDGGEDTPEDADAHADADADGADAAAEDET